MLKRLVILTSVLCLAAAGCSKKSDEHGAGGKADRASETKKPAVTAAWFGKTPATPPGALAKLKPGMTMDEAKKLAPEATQPGMSEADVDNVAIGAQDLPGGITLLVYMPPDKAGLVSEAWGPGIKVDRGGTPVTVWFNPDAGIRAAQDDKPNGDRSILRFERYQPLTKLLGTGSDLPFLDKGFAGKTKKELQALYPALADGEFLTLPPTEWEFASDISLSPYPMGDDKPVESLAFSIPFKTPEQQAEIMKVIEAKWGKAGEEVPFGSIGDEKTYVYNKKDPHIEVTGPGGYNKSAITIRIGGK